MTQISVKLPGDLIASVDAAAYQLRRTRGNYGDSSLNLHYSPASVLYTAQFSTRRPSTRANSLMLLVTSTKPSERAWPAIN